MKSERNNKGQFAQGNPGKPEGAKNKITQSIKEVITEVFHKVQAPESKVRLEKFAQDNPVAFYSLVAKIIPQEVTGKDGKELVLNIIVADEDKHKEIQENLKVA